MPDFDRGPQAKPPPARSRPNPQNQKRDRLVTQWKKDLDVSIRDRHDVTNLLMSIATRLVRTEAESDALDTELGWIKNPDRMGQ